MSIMQPSSWIQNAPALWNIRKSSVSLTDIEIFWWRSLKVSISESEIRRASITTTVRILTNVFDIATSMFLISESDNRRSSLSAKIFSIFLLWTLYWWVKMVASIKPMAWENIHAAVRYNLKKNNTMRGNRRSDTLTCIVMGASIISI